MPDSGDGPVGGGTANPLPQGGEAIQSRLARLERELEEMSAAYDRLNQSNLELLELDRLKSDFIGTVSHELKTPLTTLLGYNEYLQSGKLGPLSDQQARAVDAMSRSLKKLHRQISELLDFTRLESGKLTVDPEPFPLKPLADEVLGGQRVMLERKGLEAGAVIADDVAVNADRGRIAQVLDNLLVNAIKFTDKGGIKITAEPHPPEGQVMIKISDTGIGIPEEAIPRVFDRFFQVESGDASRRQAGMGLGLSIVKAIVAAHGGRISVKSRVGEGTEITFTLPLAGGN
jgi:signal transduction histidine kinase